MLEALDLTDRPDHCIEDRSILLGHRDPLGQHGAAGAERGHHEVDGCEGGHGKVVAEETGRPGEGALRAGRAQGQRRHVPAARPPDLPVGVNHRREPTLIDGLDGGLHRNVTHGTVAPPNLPAGAPARRDPRRDHPSSTNDG